MTERDNELDAILEPLRNAQPDAAQLALWQKNVIPRRMALRRTRIGWEIAKIAVAASLGFVVGAAVFSGETSTPKTEVANLTEVDSADATVEYIFAKSE